jgi:5-methylthioadenosine/S-adenosylhomocysteine deaminase
MQSADYLLCPEWLITMEPNVTAQTGQCVAVANGRIAAVLPLEEALQRFNGTRLDLPQQVLMPGLVNAHTHAAMSLLRGIADDLALEPWLSEHIWPAEARWVGPEFVADGTRLAGLEMLLGGVTCFADMYFFPGEAAEAAVATGLRAVIGIIAIQFPSAYAQDPSEYLQKGLAVRDRYRDEPRITSMFAPHAPYTVDDATLTRIRQLADELEIPIQMHIHETAAEVDEAVASHGQRPLTRLDRLGLVTPSLMAVHATCLSPEEIDLLGSHAATVVHCPRSNLKLASGACPTAALARAGVNLALGSDGAASNNRLDLWGDIQLAGLLAKWVDGDAATMPAGEVLKMATLGGAKALGLGNEIGSVTAGKWADLVSVDLSSAATQPVYDPVSQLVYSAGPRDVRHVWIAGEQRVRDGQPLDLDVNDIVTRAQDWARRIQAGD